MCKTFVKSTFIYGAKVWTLHNKTRTVSIRQNDALENVLQENFVGWGYNKQIHKRKYVCSCICYKGNSKDLDEQGKMAPRVQTWKLQELRKRGKSRRDWKAHVNEAIYKRQLKDMLHT